MYKIFSEKHQGITCDENIYEVPGEFIIKQYEANIAKNQAKLSFDMS